MSDDINTNDLPTANEALVENPTPLAPAEAVENPTEGATADVAYVGEAALTEEELSQAIKNGEAVPGDEVAAQALAEVDRDAEEIQKVAETEGSKHTQIESASPTIVQDRGENGTIAEPLNPEEQE